MSTLEQKILDILTEAHCISFDSHVGVEKRIAELLKCDKKLYSIKPLEWEKVSERRYKVNNDLISYTVHRDMNDRWELGIRPVGYSPRYITCNSLDEAKSKAQEDWNNRISQYLTEYKEGK